MSESKYAKKPQVMRDGPDHIAVFVGSAYQFMSDDEATSLRDQLTDLLVNQHRIVATDGSQEAAGPIGQEYRGKVTNRDQAIALACACAKAKPQSYYAEPFHPHEWVIDAIMQVAADASQEGEPFAWKVHVEGRDGLGRVLRPTERDAGAGKPPYALFQRKEFAESWAAERIEFYGWAETWIEPLYAAPQAQPAHKFSDEAVRAWGERYDLKMSLTEMRCALEDAASLQTLPENGNG
jgi:hypothetical protein